MKKTCQHVLAFTGIIGISFLTGTAQAACSVDAGLKQRILTAWAANPSPGNTEDTPTNRDASKLEEVFNPTYYLKNNPDVNAAFGPSPNGALTHWLDNGICEGRVGSPTFSVSAYRGYTDLQAALPDNNWSYLLHYFNNGAAEGRCAVSGKEAPKSIVFSTNNTVANYNGVGTVSANNADGGLVVRQLQDNAGVVHTVCTGKLPNFTNVGYSVQIITFKFGGFNYFNQNSAGDHFGVLGASRAQLARNPSLGMSGYFGQGIIFWSAQTSPDYQLYGAEGEIFAHRRVNGSDAFSSGTTEFPDRVGVPQSTIPIYDTLSSPSGGGGMYSAMVKVKDGSVKYTVWDPQGQLIVNRLSTKSANSPNPWADGLTFFAFCRQTSCTSQYALRVEDISVSWGYASQF